MSVVHLNTNLEDIQRALASKYLSLDPINQLECIRSQNEIMAGIRQLIERRKYVHQEIIAQGGSASSLSVFDQSISYGDASGLSLMSQGDDAVGKSKFTQEFETSAMQAALREVQASCSEQTYEIVKLHLLNSKIKEAQSLEKMSAKLLEERDELASQILIFKLQKANMEKELERYRKIVAGIEEQKKNIRKKLDYIYKKENHVFKQQSSFAFKQKINLELSRKYERLVRTYSLNEAKLEKIYEELDKIWNQIIEKMQQTECKGECWRAQIMKKARKQLLEERKLIKEQSLHLEREYEVMNVVSEQFKRIFQQPQKIGHVEHRPALEKYEPNVAKVLPKE